MSTALARIGPTDVSIIRGARDHPRLGVTNLIYLHGNVDSDFEEWVLRTAVLNEQWRGAWPDAIAAIVLAGPVIVFAGLGTPAAVLVESITRLRQMIPVDGLRVFQVDPRPADQSAFFAALNIPGDGYIQQQWGEFMEELSDRLVADQQTELEGACESLLQAEGWEREDVRTLCARLAGRGLMVLGLLRARWCLADAAYLPRYAIDPELMADILLAIGLIERGTESVAVYSDSGVVEFRRDRRILGAIVVGSGRGTRSFFSIESEILGKQKRYWRYHDPMPSCAVVGGVQGPIREAAAPPQDVVVGAERSSIVTGQTGLRIYATSQLRQTPALVTDILA
jgi:hypothetical protein